MYIDCHVHCRDFNQKHKETVAHALEVAKDSGLSAIFDMPNTDPPITSRERVLERFALVDVVNSPVFYGTYIGLTPDKNQIQEAVETAREFSPQRGRRSAVVGLKMFAGESVGNLAIIKPEQQEYVCAQITNYGFGGVLVIHCEKESEMHLELWNPEHPETWNLARPEKAEVESVKDQLRFIKNAGYMGHTHFTHLSSPDSVDLVRDAGGIVMRLSAGSTPHHLLLDTSVMQFKNGILYKVNPPIRRIGSQRGLLKKFIDGEIDILETDHAPHTYEEKTGITKDAKGNPVYMSGIPNLSSWPVFTELLLEEGAAPQLIHRTTCRNPIDIFRLQDFDFKLYNLDLKKRISTKSHVREYAFEPYDSLR